MAEFKESRIPKLERHYGISDAVITMFGWIPGVKALFEKKK